MKVTNRQVFIGVIWFALGALMPHVMYLHSNDNVIKLDEFAPDKTIQFHNIDNIFYGEKSGSDDNGMISPEEDLTNNGIENQSDVVTGHDDNSITLVGQSEDIPYSYRLLKELWTMPQNEELIKPESDYRNAMQVNEPCNSCRRTIIHPLDEEMNRRRQREASMWQREESEKLEPLTICKAISPISYIGGGIVVEPLQSVRLVGISVSDVVADIFTTGKENINFRVSIESKRRIGKIMIQEKPKLNRMIKTKMISVIGNETSELTFMYNEVNVINRLLDHVIYKNTFYDMDIRDIVAVTFMQFTIHINLHIKRQLLPDLYDPGSDGRLSDKVTIITKTFERYGAIQRLVESINMFYPDVLIIVADDTERPVRIVGNNVKQIVLPFLEGFFAGRSVALSLVTTKYFLWVDDDFVFTEKTKLEIMLEKLEDPQSRLDLVAGTVNGNSYNNYLVYKYGKDSATADCISTLSGIYRQHEVFPQCDVTDAVINFFMAKTAVVRQIGFDPEYQRIGHIEFFIDGLGKMRVAACKDVDVGHERVRSPRYMFYRTRRDDSTYPKRHANHLLFSNNLQCV
ncbi:beta-1,4 N-acetylgalactosaminyltransferase 2-like [Glandiceps talaboti]